MGEGIHSLLWDGVALGASVCPYCHGSPNGRRHYDCQKFIYCGGMDYECFKIPNEKNKIQSFINEYQKREDFFEIAKLMWGESTPDEIKVNANNCPDKITIVPEIGKLIVTRLSEVKSPEKYMRDKIEELKSMI